MNKLLSCIFGFALALPSSPAIRPGKPCAGHVRKWIAIGSATVRVPKDRAPAWWMFFYFDPRQLLADADNSFNLHISLLVPDAAEPPARLGWMLRTNLTTRLRRHASALDLRLRRDHGVLVQPGSTRGRVAAQHARLEDEQPEVPDQEEAERRDHSHVQNRIDHRPWQRRPAWIGSTRSCRSPDGHRDLSSWASTP